jgi:hypothetical protein
MGESTAYDEPAVRAQPARLLRGGTPNTEGLAA